jgi:hypothetical protein
MPIEDVKINVCVVEVLARVSCAVLSGGFESEVLVSGLALLADSCSEFRCGAAVVAVPFGDDGTLACMGRVLVWASPIVICGGFRIKEVSVSALPLSAASRSAFCCRTILST